MVSIVASVAWWARTEPQRLALVYADQHLSYGELHHRVECMAAALSALRRWIDCWPEPLWRALYTSVSANRAGSVATVHG